MIVGRREGNRRGNLEVRVFPRRRRRRRRRSPARVHTQIIPLMLGDESPKPSLHSEEAVCLDPSIILCSAYHDGYFPNRLHRHSCSLKSKAEPLSVP